MLSCRNSRVRSNSKTQQQRLLRYELLSLTQENDKNPAFSAHLEDKGKNGNHDTEKV